MLTLKDWHDKKKYHRSFVLIRVKQLREEKKKERKLYFFHNCLATVHRRKKRWKRNGAN